MNLHRSILLAAAVLSFPVLTHAGPGCPMPSGFRCAAYGAGLNQADNPVLSRLFRAGSAHFFLSKSASTIARSSGVTSGRTPNQSWNPRTA